MGGFGPGPRNPFPGFVLHRHQGLADLLKAGKAVGYQGFYVQLFARYEIG